MFFRFSLILILLSNFVCFSQKERLVGEWHVVSVDNGQIYWNTKKDSVSLTEEFKSKVSNPISRQDRIADLRVNCSHNRFIFTEKDEYFQYMTENDRLLIFIGNYELFPSTNTMNLEVKGRMSTEPL